MQLYLQHLLKIAINSLTSQAQLPLGARTAATRSWHSACFLLCFYLPPCNTIYIYESAHTHIHTHCAIPPVWHNILQQSHINKKMHLYYIFHGTWKWKCLLRSENKFKYKLVQTCFLFFITLFCFQSTTLNWGWFMTEPKHVFLFLLQCAFSPLFTNVSVPCSKVTLVETFGAKWLIQIFWSSVQQRDCEEWISHLLLMQI